MPLDRTGKQPIVFDPSKLGTVKPNLAEPEGYSLTFDEACQVFNIREEHFSRLPRHFVVPVLTGKPSSGHLHHVTGYLYIVEPEVWVPQVSHGQVKSASEFKRMRINPTETVNEIKFNTGTSAKLNFTGSGAYFGIKADVKTNNYIPFKYSSTSITKNTIETKHLSDNEEIHQLFVYPTLRCRVVRKQCVDYTIDTSNHCGGLKWGENPLDWDALRVADDRLDRIRTLQLHPVPMEGDGAGDKSYILPVPEATASGDLDITTILSCKGWADWYVYDVAWEEGNQALTLAAPNNDVAFQPTCTWTTLPPVPRS